jgi:hypothetical protein
MGTRVAPAVGAAGVFVVALLGGCASPGPPLPPTLKLPRVVVDLSAERAGDEVTLRWTTPALTTDRLAITESITAEVCREAIAAPPTSKLPLYRQTTPCMPVRTVEVKPGASEVVDPLPAGLTSATAGLLAYWVQLRNADGHTAGPSGALLVASGPAPARLDGLTGTATKAGVLLQWTPGAAGPAQGAGAGDVVEVDRTATDARRADARAGAGLGTGLGTGPGPKRASELMGAAKAPAEALFRVGVATGPNAAKDGGAIDHTAQVGHSYRYTAQRVRTVEFGGLKLEVRSAVSDAVTVEMRDVFPPEAPLGLVAVPGFAAVSDGAQRPTGASAIDLSWQPVMEPRVAGYRVYRRDLGGASPEVWRRVGPELVAVPGYRDVSVAAGQRYAYRVTAVGDAGSESGPSGEVAETAPGP